MNSRLWFDNNYRNNVIFFHSKRFSLKHVVRNGKALVIPVTYLSHLTVQNMGQWIQIGAQLAQIV